VGSTLEENCLLRGDGPNGVRRIFCRRGEIPESLAVIKPLLFLFGCGVGVVRDDVFIGLVEEGVPLGAQFLEGSLSLQLLNPLEEEYLLFFNPR
jgi:hypothetical protein